MEKASKEQKGLLKKLSSIRGEVSYMQKEGRNSVQGYNFLSERQITEKFKELLEKHGVFFHYSSTIKDVRLTPTGKQFLTDVEVAFSFVDIETGETYDGVAAGQGTDSGDKGVYKAITGAIKYVFMKTFMIPTGDDPEDDSGTARGKRATARRASDEYGTSRGDDKPVTERNDLPFGEEDED